MKHPCITQEPIDTARALPQDLGIFNPRFFSSTLQRYTTKWDCCYVAKKAWNLFNLEVNAPGRVFSWLFDMDFFFGLIKGSLPTLKFKHKDKLDGNSKKLLPLFTEHELSFRFNLTSLSLVVIYEAWIWVVMVVMLLTSVAIIVQCSLHLHWSCGILPWCLSQCFSNCPHGMH